MSASAIGISYKLYNSGTLVNTVAGTGSAIDFGAVTTVGTYTVQAMDGTSGCTRIMNGSAVVTINPLPGYP